MHQVIPRVITFFAKQIQIMIESRAAECGSISFCICQEQINFTVKRRSVEAIPNYYMPNIDSHSFSYFIL